MTYRNIHPSAVLKGDLLGDGRTATSDAYVDSGWPGWIVDTDSGDAKFYRHDDAATVELARALRVRST